MGYDATLKGLRQLERYQKPLWKALARVASPLLAPLYRVADEGTRATQHVRESPPASRFISAVPSLCKNRRGTRSPDGLF